MEQTMSSPLDVKLHSPIKNDLSIYDTFCFNENKSSNISTCRIGESKLTDVVISRSAIINNLKYSIGEFVYIGFLGKYARIIGFYNLGISWVCVQFFYTSSEIQIKMSLDKIKLECNKNEMYLSNDFKILPVGFISSKVLIYHKESELKSIGINKINALYWYRYKYNSLNNEFSLVGEQKPLTFEEIKKIIYNTFTNPH